jgi:hypothetical protein
MYLKRVSRSIVITGTLLIWAVKLLIRPLQPWDGAGYFLGVAPNLFGSFLIPFGAYWFFSGRDYLLARIFRFRTAYDLGLVCSLGFGMLVMNEYLQLVSWFGRTFDYNDILFSSIGLLLSYFIFGRLQQREAVGWKSARLQRTQEEAS